MFEEQRNWKVAGRVLCIAQTGLTVGDLVVKNILDLLNADVKSERREVAHCVAHHRRLDDLEERRRNLPQPRAGGDAARQFGAAHDPGRQPGAALNRHAIHHNAEVPGRHQVFRVDAGEQLVALAHEAIDRDDHLGRLGHASRWLENTSCKTRLIAATRWGKKRCKSCNRLSVQHTQHTLLVLSSKILRDAASTPSLRRSRCSRLVHAASRTRTPAL